MSFTEKSRSKFIAEAMCVHGQNNITKVQVPGPMPCVVIFVHGVNSEGEWYLNSEHALIAGLNDRLGRVDLVANGYTGDKRQIKVLNHSPVIRFFWGYRAGVKETTEGRFAYKIPLKRRQRDYSDGQNFPYKYTSYDFNASSNYPVKNKPGPYYWGGGPFQNGTTALNMAWYDGFRPDPLPGFDVRWFNPYRERPLNAAPKRTYFVNAALRLANLIDSIYASYPNDTVAIVSHSQGTIVALLAMLYAKQVPDTLLLCNSPYCFEDKFLDGLAYGGRSPTARSRVSTFFNILERFRKSQQDNVLKSTQELRPATSGVLHFAPFYPAMPEAAKAKIAPEKGRRFESSEEPAKPYLLWSRTVSSEQPEPGVEDHHNHGRVFVYCAPHDRVMGSVAMQSIGWKGVDYRLPNPAFEPGDLNRVCPFEVFKGVLYQRQIMRAHPVGAAPDQDRPRTPRYPTDGRPFWIPGKTRIGGLLDDLAEPDKGALIYVNAPRVPQPLTADEMRHFDKENELNKHVSDMDEFEYLRGLMLEENRLRTEVVSPDEFPPENILYQSPEEFDREMTVKFSIFTDHSTFLDNEAHRFVRRVLAYDLPIGRADCFNTLSFWESLIKQADWLEQGSDPNYARGGDFKAPDMPPGLNLETRFAVAEQLQKEMEVKMDNGHYFPFGPNAPYGQRP